MGAPAGVAPAGRGLAVGALFERVVVDGDVPFAQPRAGQAIGIGAVREQVPVVVGAVFAVLFAGRLHALPGVQITKLRPAVVVVAAARVGPGDEVPLLGRGRGAGHKPRAPAGREIALPAAVAGLAIGLDAHRLPVELEPPALGRGPVARGQKRLVGERAHGGIGVGVETPITASARFERVAIGGQRLGPQKLTRPGGGAVRDHRRPGGAVAHVEAAVVPARFGVQGEPPGGGRDEAHPRVGSIRIGRPRVEARVGTTGVGTAGVGGGAARVEAGVSGCVGTALDGGGK